MTNHFDVNQNNTQPSMPPPTRTSSPTQNHSFFFSSYNRQDSSPDNSISHYTLTSNVLFSSSDEESAYPELPPRLPTDTDASGGILTDKFDSLWDSSLGLLSSWSSVSLAFASESKSDTLTLVWKSIALKCISFCIVTSASSSQAYTFITPQLAFKERPNVIELFTKDFKAINWAVNFNGVKFDLTRIQGWYATSYTVEVFAFDREGDYIVEATNVMEPFVINIPTSLIDPQFFYQTSPHPSVTCQKHTLWYI
ncbi:hypothetical protein CPB83DRAFT_900107 [Crepidotus variabilis]|uniref:Uncharacterized protein n=1 Tax=Crepidotus variabilis TaxID=179855 RepID=A0A9P6JI07_9AGAR|nr:hypothetical protein CPB83DRAFT_900107 [Crepidotus variabilis]